MNTFSQSFLALASAAILVVGGFFLGRETASLQPVSAPVARFPDSLTIEHRGIPSPIVDCLRHVQNIEDATAGLAALMCHGS